MMMIEVKSSRQLSRSLVLFHFSAMFFYLFFTAVILGYTLSTVDISTPGLCASLGFLQQFTQSQFMLWEVSYHSPLFSLSLESP